MRALLYLPLLILSASLGQAQITKPPASPRSSVTQQFSLFEATLDYGRPGVKGREIFGGLESYGKVWRTGANASTKISFNGDVKVAGEAVAAGTYALYSIPEEKTWTIILHKKTDLWGAGGYDPVNDLLRFEVPVQRLTEPWESLYIGFDKFHAEGADVVIAWNHTLVRFPIETEIDLIVMKDIDEKVRNATGEISARSYFDAGLYLFEQRREVPLAAQWVDKAIEMRPEAFWQIFVAGEIALSLGDLPKAKASAERALELAKASRAGDFGYIARCTQLLESIEAVR